jgi:hypothetical protein
MNNEERYYLAKNVNDERLYFAEGRIFVYPDQYYGVNENSEIVTGRINNDDIILNVFYTDECENYYSQTKVVKLSDPKVILFGDNFEIYKAKKKKDSETTNTKEEK